MRLLTLLLFTLLTVASYPTVAEIKKGDKLQTLVNLHPDTNRRVVYTMNYQLPELLPMCSEITVKKINKKAMVYLYNGQQFLFRYDKFTKASGHTFTDYLNNFVGTQCASHQVKKLSKVDQDGIRSGRPAVGMSKKGILFAMGRPPAHKNPDLKSDSWIYWRNRYNRVLIEFDSKGLVSNIRE